MSIVGTRPVRAFADPSQFRCPNSLTAKKRMTSDGARKCVHEAKPEHSDETFREESVVALRVISVSSCCSTVEIGVRTSANAST